MNIAEQLAAANKRIAELEFQVRALNDLRWPPLRVVVNGEIWHVYSPEYYHGDQKFSFYFYARNLPEAEAMLAAIRAGVKLPEGEIIGFSDHQPTEAEMIAADSAGNSEIH